MTFTYYRPGHADYTFDEKYGFRDYRGGGRSSGRETIGRVAAGAIASKILKELGITITTYVSSIGDVHIDRNNFDADYILKNDLNMPDPDAYEKASILLQDCPGVLADLCDFGKPAAPSAAGAGRDPSHRCELPAHRVRRAAVHLLL